MSKTTDKPEVVAWLHRVRQESDVITDKVRHVWGTPLGSMGEYTEPLIRLSDYERLQAMHVKLAEALEAMLAVNVVEADVSYGTACAKAEQALDDLHKGGDQCTTNA